jgi:hypothetical protein
MTLEQFNKLGPVERASVVQLVRTLFCASLMQSLTALAAESTRCSDRMTRSIHPYTRAARTNLCTIHPLIHRHTLVAQLCFRL